jgi:hypothetical protein
MIARPALAAAVTILAACGTPAPSTSATNPAPGGTPPGPSARADATSSAVHVAHRPPTAKDVIDAAVASAAVPLTVSSTCTKAGTEPTDATIGRYLAGFLAELSSPDKKNWIETRVEPGRSADGEDVSVCTLTIRHEDGDDRWGWGVRFQVRSSDGLVLDTSFTCVGAG